MPSSKLIALIQARDDDSDDDFGAPAAAVYESKSGSIVDVLLDILDALFKFDDGLAHAAGALRKARPKEQEGYKPDDDEFRSTR